MRNTILKFVFLLLPFCLPAQAIYNGHVQDVVSGNAIAGVELSLLNTDLSVRSNYHGNFLIKNAEQDSIQPLLNSYRFYNNAMIWEGPLNVSLMLYAMDGRLVANHANLGTSGSYIFPTLPVGVYLLRVGNEEEIQHFKAFSDGQRTSIADKGAVWHRSSVPARPDTLLLTKEGYYDRQIVLSGRDTLLNINLLRKENGVLHYFNELISPIAFDLVSGLPSRSHDGGVYSVKIIYNTRDELMYYMNANIYDYHFTFAQAQLDFRQGNNIFNITQYRTNPDRYLYPANLNYYESLDKYILHLVTANEMSCEELKTLYDKVIATSYLEGKLFLLANRPEFNDCDVPLISPEELYEGQNYQALNLAENYGYLTKVKLTDLEDTYLGRRDIVLLDGIPNDVSVVAGIITTEFQTPLSHINVLSHNRKTPNMALRDGWENEQLAPLVGELVYLRVQSDSFEIRPASLSEASAFWAQNEPQEAIELTTNTEVQGLVDLYEADYTYVDIIGGKATNFA
ncbi:MAG: T9SS type A sorting domain-containing protein [Bacteroidota bacterium]